MNIRLAVPSIDEHDLRAVQRVLESGFLVQGPEVAAFERQVARAAGTEHAVAVANGTAALHLGLLALGVGPGDRVAVPTYSWPATANVVVLCGAEPVFVDIDPSTYNMDPALLDRALERQQVKAVLPVHAFGGMACMPRLRAVAEAHGARVMEDAACALGAEVGGRRAGSWGVAGCFSFHPRKAITTGEGGAVTTDDPEIARAIRVMRNHGQDPDAPAPDFVAAGYNLRMTEFQAALGGAQMAKLDRLVESRRGQSNRYDELLAGTPLMPPGIGDESRHVFQSYVALLPQEAAPRRAEIIATLKDGGIETTIGTYHMPLIRYFRERYGFKPGDFPTTDDVAARAISLPLYEALTAEQQQQVVAALLGQL